MEMVHCRNCGNVFTANFCNSCGQKKFSQKDKSLKVIFEEMFHFLTHFEGTFFKTFKTVLLNPGRLTAEYCMGIRKKYYKPISFFLLLIFLYLLFPFVEGLNMRLEYYPRIPIAGEIIEGQINQKLLETGMPFSELAATFRQKSEKTAKILLLILIPLTAIGLYISTLKRRPAYDYMIAATEINIFFLLFFFMLSPIIMTILDAIFELPLLTDKDLFPMFVGVFLTWLTIWVRRFFQAHWFYSILAALVIIVMHSFATHFVYKWILFEITFLLV